MIEQRLAFITGHTGGVHTNLHILITTQRVCTYQHSATGMCFYEEEEGLSSSSSSNIHYFLIWKLDMMINCVSYFDNISSFIDSFPPFLSLQVHL